MHLNASRESLIIMPEAYDGNVVVHQGWLNKQGEMGAAAALGVAVAV
jgi:hypothetical protein